VNIDDVGFKLYFYILKNKIVEKYISMFKKVLKDRYKKILKEKGEKEKIFLKYENTFILI
jgi:hypothetical protein